MDLSGAAAGAPARGGARRAGDLDESVRATLAGFGYSATLAVRTDQEFASDLRPGDVVVAENVYLDATGEKGTALGRGFFVRSRTDYRTVSGRPAGSVTLTVLQFAPGNPAPIPAAAPPPGDASGSPAAECGPVRVPVTTTLIVAGALATRDFYPVHHDRDFARAHGNTDIVMNILTTNGLLAASWAGGPARLGSAGWSRPCAPPQRRGRC
ncbi:hypothetical protein [Pseudonocardia sp. GCM10023141]|uniref:hypothetical protein n=1 Tax=Pseudonocardia sp. GCM10023141 TaxID=3252653 RepID=UPI00360946D6